MSFLLQYLLHPRTVGAVKPSSKHLAQKMVEDVDFAKAKCIVEIGAGTGVFTEEIIARKKDDTVLLVFEVNRDFCRQLKEKYGKMPNVHVIYNSAEKIGHFLDKCKIPRADYIISGLPFASLPAEVSHRILEACRMRLTKEGAFLTFQYTRLKMKLLEQYFSRISVKKENRNVPPAYVMCCSNEE